MKNVTAVTTTTLKTTIKIEFTDAPIIRCVARRDMPEFGITEGSCFYLARSSKNDGTYYLLTWNYERIQWDCRCPATCHNCRHNKLVVADCAKPHQIHSYKPLSKAEKFDALKALYDIRKASEAPEAPAKRCLDEEWYEVEIAECTAAVRSMKRDTSAKIAALYTNTVKMEQAPSGTWVPMR